MTILHIARRIWAWLWETRYTPAAVPDGSDGEDDDEGHPDMETTLRPSVYHILCSITASLISDGS